MAQYRIHVKLVVDVDSTRTPAQIHSALIQQSPTLRNGLKDAFRAQVAKDTTGNTTITGWHYHATGLSLDGDTELDLDDLGPVDEVEP
jgi:hypothetical protein